MTSEGSGGQAPESTQSEGRILIVDDDRKLCRLIADYLGAFGFKVDAVHTGPDGLERGASGGYEAVILDCMLPGMDGFDVLRRLRQLSAVPVLMLTALGDEPDRIVGLEMGADDYLPKTFSTRELLARLRAVIRRAAAASAASKAADGAAEPIAIQDLRVDGGSRSATIGGQLLALTPVEFDLLWCLARAAGRVLTRDQLLDEISGRDYEAFDRSIDVHISALRRKLGDDPKQPRYIRTVRSAGYMMVRHAEDQP